MWLPNDNKASSFSSKNLRNFFPPVVLLPNEDFGRLARDLNLAVFSMVIFLSTLK